MHRRARRPGEPRRARHRGPRRRRLAAPTSSSATPGCCGAELDRDPANPRTVFYLANTERDLGHARGGDRPLRAARGDGRLGARRSTAPCSRRGSCSAERAERLAGRHGRVLAGLGGRPHGWKPVYELASRLRLQAPPPHRVRPVSSTSSTGPSRTTCCSPSPGSTGGVCSSSSPSPPTGWATTPAPLRACDRLLAMPDLPEGIRRQTEINREFSAPHASGPELPKPWCSAPAARPASRPSTRELPGAAEVPSAAAGNENGTRVYGGNPRLAAGSVWAAPASTSSWTSTRAARRSALVYAPRPSAARPPVRQQASEGCLVGRDPVPVRIVVLVLVVPVRMAWDALVVAGRFLNDTPCCGRWGGRLLWLAQGRRSCGRWWRCGGTSWCRSARGSAWLGNVLLVVPRGLAVPVRPDARGARVRLGGRRDPRAGVSRAGRRTARRLTWLYPCTLAPVGWGVAWLAGGSGPCSPPSGSAVHGPGLAGAVPPRRARACGCTRWVLAPVGRAIAWCALGVGVWLVA